MSSDNAVSYSGVYAYAVSSTASSIHRTGARVLSVFGLSFTTGATIHPSGLAYYRRSGIPLRWLATLNF